jgi:hypothetical protein
MNKPQIATRSLFFDIREGELVEIPVIEFISSFKSYIMSLIKERIDPDDNYIDYEITLVRNGVHEYTNFSDINLDQAIHIALLQGIERETILGNPEHFTVIGADENTYMFSNAIFVNYNDKILHRLAQIIVDIFFLEPTDCVHLFIPNWMQSDIAGYILEICFDPTFGPNLSIIDYDHPRRQEIENGYLP